MCDCPEPGGWLALVATPIGNLEDTTLRAIRTLREADLIAAEDTRRARKLCAHFEISTQLTAYHAHNEHRKTQWLLDAVASGRKVAVLSDAGTPCVSDPGFLIVRSALERGIEPEIIPGVSAVTYAVVAAGFPVDRFVFLGYPPVKAGKRRTFLTAIADYHTTAILFESPHRIGRLLGDIADCLGRDTQVALIREATKRYEERIRGTAGELSERLCGRNWKGEIVLAVHGRGVNDDQE